MGDSQLEESQTSLIPDFFFEFIARIIPGLVAIVTCIYWATEDLKSISPNVGLSLLTVVAAWVIGVTLDVAVFALPRMFVSPRLLNKFVPVSKTWPTIRQLPAWERRIMLKCIAFIIFFRGMMVISVAILGVCIVVHMDWWPGLSSCLPALHDNHRFFFWASLGFPIVFFVCWKHMRSSLTGWDNEHNRQNKQPPRSVTNPQVTGDDE